MPQGSRQRKFALRFKPPRAFRLKGFADMLFGLLITDGVIIAMSVPFGTGLARLFGNNVGQGTGFL
jgi:hypothetical protein